MCPGDGSYPVAGNFQAKQRKQIHDNSGYAFPKIANLTRDMILKHNVNDTYTSSYSVDYARKNGRPAIPRPCSATRRNRPHPSKNFLNWRLPSELVSSMKITDDAGYTKWNPNQELQNFYNKFNGTFYQVPAEPIAKDSSCSPIPQPPQRQRLLKREEIEVPRLSQPVAVASPQVTPVPSPIQFPKPGHAVLGRDDAITEEDLIKELLDASDKRYLIKFLRSLSPETLLGLKKWLQSRDQSRDEDIEDDDMDTTKCPPLPGPGNYYTKEDKEYVTQTPPSTPMKDDVTNECTMPLCLEQDVRPSFSKLYHSTPREERKIVADLIEAGNHGYLEKFLSRMVRPEAITGIQSWLISHDDRDREVALRFLGDIRRPSPKRSPKPDREPAVLSPVERGEKFAKVKVKSKRRPSHGKNCSCSVCDKDRSNKILKALSRQGTCSVINEMRKALEYVPPPKYPGPPRNLGNRRKNTVAKLGGEGPLTSGMVANKGALFMQPHRIWPSHFVIHPELP